MVVTNAHIPSFYDVEDTLYTSMMLLVKRMALAVKAVYNPLQVVMETSGAGNRHVHIHVLPVYSLYDLVPRDVQERQRARPATDAELTLILHDLRRYLHA
jgi:diadenosine tetraphosphate (Ap4A) HIT family hydrolase